MAAELKPTHPSETRSGHNDIVVKSVQFGLQPMIMEKDIAVPVRDGHVLYANVFRPNKEGRYPVVIAGDCYGKDSIHIEYAKTIGYTLGAYDVSLFAAWEGPDPGFWVPNGYVVVKLGLRGNSGSKGRVEPMMPIPIKDRLPVISIMAPPKRLALVRSISNSRTVTTKIRLVKIKL